MRAPLALDKARLGQARCLLAAHQCLTSFEARFAGRWFVPLTIASRRAPEVN